MVATTYADVLRPSIKKYAFLYDAALVVGMSLFIGLSAQLVVRLPFSPVPVSGQTLAVLLTGALLGGRRGALAVIAYLAEGLAGLPVFAGGAAGLAYALGPTGGYLVGFVAGAYVTGWLAERGWDRKMGATALAMIAGNLAIYTFGVSWLAVLFGAGKALSLGLYPFAVGDLFKVVLAAALLPAGWRLIK